GRARYGRRRTVGGIRKRPTDPDTDLRTTTHRRAAVYRPPGSVARLLLDDGRAELLFEQADRRDGGVDGVGVDRLGQVDVLVVVGRGLADRRFLLTGPARGRDGAAARHGRVDRGEVVGGRDLEL